MWNLHQKHQKGNSSKAKKCKKACVTWKIHQVSHENVTWQEKMVNWKINTKIKFFFYHFSLQAWGEQDRSWEEHCVRSFCDLELRKDFWGCISKGKEVSPSPFTPSPFTPSGSRACGFGGQYKRAKGHWCLYSHCITIFCTCWHLALASKHL